MSEPLLHCGRRLLAELDVLAAIQTADTGKPLALEAGQVWVNCYQAADSALPFAGTKESGWGRETCRETLEEYLETKTVVVSL